MTMNRKAGSRIVLAAGLCAIFAAASRGSGAQVEGGPKIVLKDGKPELALPAPLAEFINKKLPDYHVPSDKDMIGNWAAYLKKDSVPYACWGDFNGDGRTDVVLIMIGKDTWGLFAFHQTAKGGYHFFEPGGFPGPDEDFYKSNAAQDFNVYTVRAGQELKTNGTSLSDYKAKRDTFAFFFLKDPMSGNLYEWRAYPDSKYKDIRKYGSYGASGFNDMTD
jgi:hypothetical protein